MSGYTGISFPFRFGGKGGVEKSTTNVDDYSHIQESIQQIILTGIGERIMETRFGSEVRSQLFKGVEDETDISILKFEIQEALERWEPRIAVTDIEVTPIENSESTGLKCDIRYEVLKYMSEDSLTLVLSY